MSHSKNPKHLTTIQTSKISDLPQRSDTINNNPPSCTISITRKGEELSLRPISPYRYPISLSNENFKSINTSKHTRFLTTPGIFKFIPATEVVPNEKNQNPEDENPTEEVSDDAITNFLYDEQVKHSIIYPSICSNKYDLLGNTKISPLDFRVSSLFALSKTKSCKKNQVQSKCVDKKSVDKKKVLFFMLKSKREDVFTRIYCEKCKENMRYSVRVRNIKGSL
ncbi:hypothetical protein SteCoe_10295 [Stentor coeruleus]|uniref:Uncharacterized protein n=1 Tax=Stentor coeruleus TaxID=5963 RepID=A0A1R2CG00_9CILI|nr:hypothetical protein SteCoe_10295 [Stentor coeruleus]